MNSIWKRVGHVRQRLTLLPLVLLILAWTPPLAAQLVVESGSLREFLAGSEPNAAYDNWISHISENIARPGYNVYAPEDLDPQLNGFGAFQVLEDDAYGQSVMELFRQLFDHLLAGETEAALQALEDGPAVGYQLVQFSDTTLQRDYFMLREVLSPFYFDPGVDPGPEDDVTGGFDRGWGLFVFRPGAERPEVIVQAPHPCDDFPSPFFAVEFFLMADAGLLMINGAGREVEYYDNPFTNEHSLSDPTRNCFTPWEAAHEQATVYWQDQGLDELVIQIHTYDDLAHRDLRSCVAVGGRHNRIHYPVLYDTGGGSKGLLSNLSQPVHAANSLGWLHEEWRIQDFIASNQLYPVAVSGGIPDSLIWISVSPWLWGYRHSCQFDYTFGEEAQGYPECDRMERVIHIEVDELPGPAHGQGNNVYYNTSLGGVASWQHFADAWNFALPFYEGLLAARDSLRAFEDADPPTAPGELRLTGYTAGSLFLEWEPSLSVYFDTYQVLVDTAETIGEGAWIFDRGNAEELCWPGTRDVEVTGLVYQQTYTLAVRGFDDQWRFSPLSIEVHGMPDDTDPPEIEVLAVPAAFPGDSIVIQASITDETGVQSALLRWTTNDITWYAAAMEQVVGSLYSGAAPPQESGTQVRYRVEAVDLSGHDNTAVSSENTLTVLWELYGDGFNFSSDFGHQSFGGGTDQWHLSLARVREGTHSWKFGGSGFGDYANNAAGWLESPQYLVPVGVGERFAAFWCWIEAETVSQEPDSCYDGAVIQLSADLGEWESALLAPGYTHALYSQSSVPLDWPQPMLGGSASWSQYIVVLPAEARRLRLRFGFVSDGSVTREGWYVDDFKLGGVVPEDPELVTELSISYGGGRFELSWLPVVLATSYRVYGSDNALLFPQQPLAEVVETHYTYPLHYAEFQHYFRVTSVIPDALARPPGAPENAASRLTAGPER